MIDVSFAAIVSKFFLKGSLNCPEEGWLPGLNSAILTWSSMHPQDCLRTSSHGVRNLSGRSLPFKTDRIDSTALYPRSKKYGLTVVSEGLLFRLSSWLLNP